MILVAMLPGGVERHQDLNKLLAPIVTELLMLWKGCKFKTASKSNDVFVRAALLLVAADLPAGRKVCGFKNFNACCSRSTVSPAVLFIS